MVLFNGVGIKCEESVVSLANMSWGHELVIASSAGHDTEIRILVNLGADVNFMSRGNIPLTAASKRGQLETVKILLKYGARINEPDRGGETALMKAASTGNPDIVRLLVERGADLNIRSSAGNTALAFGRTERTP